MITIGAVGCRAPSDRATSGGRSEGAPDSVATAQGTLRPPFRKLWSFNAEAQIDSFVVTELVVFFGAYDCYGAVDLATGRLLWSVSPSQGLMSPYHSDTHVAYDGDTLYVAIGRQKLAAYEAQTGKERWSLPMKGRGSRVGSGSEIGVYKGTVFCELEDGVLAAIDTTTRVQRWATKLRVKSLVQCWATKLNVKWLFGEETSDGRMSVKPFVDDDSLFVGTYAGQVLSLDPQTGQVRWRHVVAEGEHHRWVSGIAADRQRLYCTTAGGELVALNLGSGRILWRFAAQEAIYGEPILADNLVFFGAEDGTLYAVNKANGRGSWSAALSREMYPDVSPPVVCDGQILVTVDGKLFAFDRSGRMLWQWDTEHDLFGQPITVLSDGVLLAGSRAFRRFVMGEPPALPSSALERQALTEQLVARFDSLTEDQERDLRKLGHEAFSVLLPLVQERLEAYETRAAAIDSDCDEALDQARRKFAQAMEVLGQIATKEDTPEMLALLERAKKRNARSRVLQWLVEKGDEEHTIPLFLGILKKEKPDWGYGYSATSIALYGVARSHDPRAVSFLIEQLSSHDADPEIRHEAFVNLARTGGTDGVTAVLAARDRRREIPSLEQSMGIDLLNMVIASERSGDQRHWPTGTKLLATRKGKDGVLWGLFTSRVLGSSSDLWVAKHDGTHWCSPLFTGVDQEELGKADWFTKFVGNASLRKDTDGDGWTNLVEQRLGTNPAKPDTDGDGLIDSRDKNPLVAPHPLGEVQQVLAAAFEARFRFIGERNVPCLVQLPEGVEPFELSGWDWIIVTQGARGESPLTKLVGEGIAAVSFWAPSFDLSGGAVRGRERTSVILWNQERTEAKLELETYYGGLNATGYDIRLRKSGEHWVVIEATMQWIS